MSERASIVALVPAAGSGLRMQTTTPKQYLRIGDKTILEHTLHALLACDVVDRIVVALHPLDAHFATLSVSTDPRITTVKGGETRAQSVLAGLKTMRDTEWALVHDAARPCVSVEDIKRLVSTVVASQQGGILAVPIVDTVKKATENGLNQIERTLDRTFLWGAVTPQCFLVKELKTSLEKALKKGLTITDEATAIEYNGGHPLLVAGRRDNIKITQPEDLPLATFYLRSRDVNSVNNNKENQCE